MSEPAAAATPASATTTARQRRGGGGVLVLLALALLAAGLLGWRWWQEESASRTAQAGLFERVEALEARVDAVRRDQRANAERVQQAAATNRLLREELLGLGQRAALLEDNVADLAQAGAGGVRALRLDEAELLLVVAEQRVRAGDIPAADQAYAQAGQALEHVDGPGVIDARQSLAQERAAVAALGPDPGAAARGVLDALEAALPGLPARAAPRVPDGAPWWRRLAARIVDVRPTAGAPVAAPAERAAGVAALQVELALARMALERRDAAAFDAAVGRIDRWLGRLWPDSEALERQRRALRALRGTALREDPAELGTTLAQLRRLRAG